VRVPVNDGAEAGRNRIKVQIVEVVDDIEASLSGLNNFVLRQGIHPLSIIHITPHSHHGCYCSQALNYLRITDVPCVNNQLGLFQGFQCLLPNQTVRIRYDSDYFSIHVPFPSVSK